MQSETIVLSSDNIRGALLLKALQKGGFDCLLCKNLFDAHEMIRDIKPNLLVIDSEGFYQNELNVLSSLSYLLKETSVLIVSNKPNYGAIDLKARSVKWCICNPLDLEMVTTMAKELMTEKTDDTLKNLLPLDKKEEEEEDATPDTEEEKLEDDLTGYLGLK